MSKETFDGPNIKIDLNAWNKIRAFERATPSTEVQGRLIMSPDDPFHVVDAVILSQDVEAGFAQNAGNALIDEYQEWEKKYGVEEAGNMFANIRGIWHIHPNAATSHSQTDYNTLQNLLNEQSDDFHVSIIMTHAGVIDCRLFLQVDPGNSLLRKLGQKAPSWIMHNQKCELVIDHNSDALEGALKEWRDTSTKLAEQETKRKEKMDALKAEFEARAKEEIGPLDDEIKEMTKEKETLDKKYNDVLRNEEAIPADIMQECKAEVDKKVKKKNNPVTEGKYYAWQGKSGGTSFPKGGQTTQTSAAGTGEKSNKYCTEQQVYIGELWCEKRCADKDSCKIKSAYMEKQKEK